MMTMSKFFGPPAGPVKLLDNSSDPLLTTVRSAPSLVANVPFSPAGPNDGIVERLIVTLGNVVLNAAPVVVSGRKAIPVIVNAAVPKSLATWPARNALLHPSRDEMDNGSR